MPRPPDVNQRLGTVQRQDQRHGVVDQTSVGEPAGDGRAAYRLAPGRADDLPPTPGALQPAVQRLRRDAAALKDIARWPGMSPERACRLLNALYLSGALMVTRSHPAAREAPPGWADRPARGR